VTVRYATFLPVRAGRYAARNALAASSQPSNAADVSTTGSSHSRYGCASTRFRLASTSPDTNPPVISHTDSTSERLLTDSSHSRDGSDQPLAGGTLCFSRQLWIRYIKPATNPTHTDTVAATKSQPCA